MAKYLEEIVEFLLFTSRLNTPKNHKAEPGKKVSVSSGKVKECGVLGLAAGTDYFDLSNAKISLFLNSPYLAVDFSRGVNFFPEKRPKSTV